MKTINFTLPVILILFSLAPASAQTSSVHGSPLQSIKDLNGGIYRNPNAEIDRYLRTTSATGSRITGETDLDNNGAAFVYSDSIILTYSGSRGGDLNHLGTQLKFDNAYIYNYNGTSWVNATYEYQTFDASDEVQSTVAQTWNATTSTWVNADENIYIWSGGNLQSYVYQVWDSAGSMWTNNAKTVYTYDGAGNILSETDQNWDGSTSAWVNSYSYIYTYNANNKITTQIDQSWDTVSNSWINQDKQTYTYDVTNTYVLSQLSQLWNSGSSSWVNYSQHIYTYDGMNDQLTALAQTWNGTSWDNYSLATYSSFVAQLPQTEIDQTWNTSTLAFDNSQMFTYTYNSFNQETSSASTSWNIGGFWQPTTSDRESRFYYQNYVTGVAAITAGNDEVMLYPVPAADGLNISVNWREAQPFSAAIYNIAGAVVNQWQVPACSSYNIYIPLDLQPGFYFLKLNGASSNMVKQFVVIK